MFWSAKEGSVRIGQTDMNYIAFGSGRESIVLLPGLGDGLVTVKGKAVLFAALYRMYARDYRVYVFSRKNDLPVGMTTRDMARDQAEAMALLGIGSAYVVGVSQGGMIAQHLAIDHPELVKKLILAVTMPSQNETVQAVIGNWMELARRGECKRLLVDIAEKSYSERYLKRYRALYPVLNLWRGPKSYDRYLIQAEACLTHDASGRLQRISCPTLVIGGCRDQIVSGEASKEIAAAIAGSGLVMYPELGHGAYEEAKDFHQRIMAFLQDK